MAACAIDIPVQRVGGSCLDWSRNNVNMGLSGVLTFLLLLEGSRTKKTADLPCAAIRSFL